MPSEGAGPEEPTQPTAPSPPPSRAERRPRPRARRSSVPQHLLSEDRYEYERILAEALLSAPHRPELAAVGQRLNTEQLRLMALNATPLIAAAAANEYQHYVKVREELRSPALPIPVGARGADPARLGMEDAAEPAPAPEGSASTGADAVAVTAVLAPVFAGAAAAIFLLVGFLLKVLDRESAASKDMIAAGWLFGAVTAAAVLVAGIGLLLTALHNSPSREPGPPGRLSDEVTQAKVAWREALLERGILPFLREALADPGTAPPVRTTASSAHSGRTPRLDSDRPSPDGTPAPGPRPSTVTSESEGPDPQL
ncbi:hypothetical protein [Streptomyces adustus]|uniref:hypothetical protein n=1 Tax=Streptomyces adustus TaxID=1609272 RepID=UPI001EE4C9AD|nr:hypothetical protein [Streptomyces adustus]